MAPRVQILDACVLINLLASGEIEEILRVAAYDSLICSAVKGESVYLRTDDPQAPLDPIDLSHLIESGLLTVCNIEGDREAELYVDYASALDDGEAMSVAIAISRGFVLATDERKARRLFLEAESELERLTSTSEMIRRWAEEMAVPAERVKAALLNIEKRARYQPPTTDVNYQWWGDSCR
ncbi:MAG TPA: hypothetical protein VNO14_10850 [Blastocatellia bacterium]|jgi:predicted nucleic acid-binding protein|nr:hypothetical protein [Blastocatellia bacterium]